MTGNLYAGLAIYSGAIHTRVTRMTSECLVQKGALLTEVFILFLPRGNVPGARRISSLVVGRTFGKLNLMITDLSNGYVHEGFTKDSRLITFFAYLFKFSTVPI